MHRDLLPLAIVAFLLPSTAEGQRLPIRAYTTADGLAHNTVNRIVRDSRGFLWFATNDGLSRFDGYSFSNYSVEHGLPHRTVMDLLETRDGELWVATFGGLVYFRPDGIPAERVVYASDTSAAPLAAGGRSNQRVEGPMFATIVPSDEDPRARALISLLESRDGTIWCGTRKGLFRLARAGGRLELLPVDIGFPNQFAEQKYINDLVEDDYGSLWAATPSGLYRRWYDGTAARYDAYNFMAGFEHLHDLMKDRQGRIWVGTRYDGFFRFTADGSRKPPVIAEHHAYPGRARSWVNQLQETSDGRFWVSTYVGLVELLSGSAPDPSRFVAYNRRHGLSHQEVTAMAEDAGGNLWIASWSGVMKLARNGFVTYSRQEGVAGGLKVFEDMTGQLYALGHTFQPGLPGNLESRDPGAEHIVLRYGRFDGGRFEWFMPRAPYIPGWVPEGSTIQRRNGEWWLAAATGLFRYPVRPHLTALQNTLPVRVFTTKDGLPAVQVYHLFEDSRGDVWFSVYSPTNGLLRWNSASDTLTDMDAVEGFPPIQDELPRALGEDAAGNVWVGLNSGVARYRGGRFTFYTAADGLPSGAVGGIHAGAAGRLWLATSRGGLVRIDNPGADRPIFTRYTTEQGLSGNTIEVLTEDRYGRIYAGTGRGVDQLEPETGRVKHFTSEDGLAIGWMIAAFRDRAGALWFGTHTGLSRFVPPEPKALPPPTILITGLMVGGAPRSVSAVAETQITLPDLDPDSNQLQIDFASLRFAAGERLRYQYRLDGADSDWGPITSRRSVTYARLAPGSYRFLVRAVNADGLPSPDPAVVTFTVLPPLWLRWWFLSLAALGVVAAALAFHRYRLARILELERVRTRIATDLHDDVGANLTRIAILSEVARQQPRRGSSALDAPLSSIAEIARESVAIMSDIVWAISPERDTLRDVTRRMRAHAEEVFASRDIRLMMDLPELAQSLRLGVNIRRDLYLIFKEAVNNAARHSRCGSIAITLRADPARLWLEVTDDGAGFDPHAHQDGTGLGSMRRRAARLGASLDVVSGHGAGTTVRLSMAVRESRAPSTPASNGR